MTAMVSLDLDPKPRMKFQRQPCMYAVQGSFSVLQADMPGCHDNPLPLFGLLIPFRPNARTAFPLLDLLGQS